MKSRRSPDKKYFSSISNFSKHLLGKYMWNYNEISIFFKFLSIFITKINFIIQRHLFLVILPVQFQRNTALMYLQDFYPSFPSFITSLLYEEKCLSQLCKNIVKNMIVILPRSKTLLQYVCVWFTFKKKDQKIPSFCWLDIIEWSFYFMHSLVSVDARVHQI